jgi:copper transport protein
MRRLAAAGAVLAALALPGSALAHANLLERTPDYGKRLASSPHSVSLAFDQGVDVFADSIEVRSAKGVLVTSGPAHATDEGRIATVPLRRLPRGAYTVRWHVTSYEGHVLSGVYTFGVRVVPPPPTEAYGSAKPTAVEYVVRWGYFLGLALLVGGLAFRLLVVGGRATPAVERRFYLVTGAGVVACIELGTLGFLLRARDAFQLPLGRLIYGDLSPLAEGTRFGTAFIAMTLGFALVAALIFLAWLTDRPLPFLWMAFVVGLVLCSGLSLSGHSAVEAGSTWRSELADWVHLSAACLWVGGVVMLAFVVWRSAPELRRDAFLRFSQLAAVLVALMVGAGAYLAYIRLPEASDLWQDHYGRVLLLKSALVALALSWGALHHFVVRPALQRGSGIGSHAIARSLLGESAVAMAVLLVAAVLVDADPPARPAKQTTPASQVRR